MKGISGGGTGLMLDGLRQEVKRIVGLYCKDQIHGEAALRALGRRGFALHPEAPCRAGALTLHVYQAISPLPSSAAFHGAAGVELIMESAYMFDHVADQKLDPKSGLSPAEELALAITLMTCGFAAASEAVHQGGRDGCNFYPLTQLFRSSIDASAGQFLDAYFEKRDLGNTDEALRMAALKAGSLGRLAAEFGAGLATGEFETVSLLGDFGSNMFTYAQLIDDLRDACPEHVSQGDLARHKKTLPVVFFYNSLEESCHNGGNRPTRFDVEGDCLDVRRDFEACGADTFCAIVAEAFLNRTQANLAMLRGRVSEVRGLEEFLGSIVRSSSECVPVS